MYTQLWQPLMPTSAEVWLHSFKSLTSDDDSNNDAFPQSCGRQPILITVKDKHLICQSDVQIALTS